MATVEKLERQVKVLAGMVYMLVGLVLVLVVTAVLGIPQLISVSDKASDASEVATAAAKDATRATTDSDRTQKCLIEFGSDFVDALNARTADTARYQEADDARDKVLVRLLTSTSITDQRILGGDLLEVTKAKQAALQSIKDGRKSDEYPDPPREVCPQ